MRKKIIYTNEPIMLGRTVKDFLPPPNEIIFRHDSGTKNIFTLREPAVAYTKDITPQYRKKHYDR